MFKNEVTKQPWFVFVVCSICFYVTVMTDAAYGAEHNDPSTEHFISLRVLIKVLCRIY